MFVGADQGNPIHITHPGPTLPAGQAEVTVSDSHNSSKRWLVSGHHLIVEEVKTERGNMATKSKMGAATQYSCLQSVCAVTLSVV